MVLIIIGHRGITKCTRVGQFRCPACQKQRQYRYLQSKRWLTFFFIPVVPLITQWEVVECQSCSQEFDPKEVQVAGAIRLPNTKPAARPVWPWVLGIGAATVFVGCTGLLGMLMFLLGGDLDLVDNRPAPHRAQGFQQGTASNQSEQPTDRFNEPVNQNVRAAPPPNRRAHVASLLAEVRQGIPAFPGEDGQPPTKIDQEWRRLYIKGLTPVLRDGGSINEAALQAVRYLVNDLGAQPLPEKEAEILIEELAEIADDVMTPRTIQDRCRKLQTALTMSSSHVIVLGSINTDLVIQSSRLPHPGETVLGGEFYTSAGGKGANQAVAAARTSRRPVTFIGAVGDDHFGRAALAALRQENLVCDFVRTVPGVPSGVALILVDADGENAISVASGANARLTPQDVEAVPDEVFQQAKVFLAQLESPLETVLCGLKRARQFGLRTILNPAPATPELLAGDLLSYVDLLTPNESELALLSGRSVAAREDAIQAGERIRARGCAELVITQGAQGCLVLADQIEPLPAHQVQAVDTTAAGDAFNGALAVALAEGRPLREAARWASRAAALSVTQRGAQPSLPERREVDGRN